MIVTCPSCNSRYAVDPSALGPGGRTVRCASCGHTWFCEAPADLPKSVDLPPPADAEPASAAPADGGRPAPLTVTAPRNRGGVGAAIGWLVFVIVVFGSAAGAIVARDRIVDWWPATARFYDAVGLPVGVLGAGLELRDVQTTVKDDNGTSVVVVDGSVTNVSNRPREVPRLRATARSAAEQELKNWVFSPGVLVLLPGETAKFHQELTDSPRGSANLALSFTAG